MTPNRGVKRTSPAELAPDFFAPHAELARVLTNLGQLSEALPHYAVSVRLAPQDVQLRVSWAGALARLGRSKQAVAQHREARKLQPDAPEVLSGLAWVLATAEDPAVRRGKEALALAERACRLTDYRDAAALDALAAASAELGQFDLAVEFAKKARERAARRGAQAYVDAIKKRIELYEAHTPYREHAPSDASLPPDRADSATAGTTSRPSLP